MDPTNRAKWKKKSERKIKEACKETRKEKKSWFASLEPCKTEEGGVLKKKKRRATFQHFCRLELVSLSLECWQNIITLDCGQRRKTKEGNRN